MYEFVYCCAKIRGLVDGGLVDDRLVPQTDDEWEYEAHLHSEECEWVKTKAHTIDESVDDKATAWLMTKG